MIPPQQVSPYQAVQPHNFDMQKIIPRDQTGIDFLLVSPDNDTSKRFLVQQKGKVRNVQMPYKNLNTMDVTTSNLSDFKFVAMNFVGYISLRRQANSEYFASLAGQRERVKYDFSGSQARLTNYLHFFCSLTKGAKKRGGALTDSIRTKHEYVESKSVEDVKQSVSPQNQNQQNQQQNQGKWH